MDGLWEVIVVIRLGRKAVGVGMRKEGVYSVYFKKYKGLNNKIK